MKKLITGLCLLLAGTAQAQDPKPHNPFLGRWRLTAYLKHTPNGIDTTKEYDFKDDSTLIMSSRRWRLTSIYKFDPKKSELSIFLNGKEMKFEIIFISRRKMQWHSPLASDHDMDGIVERILDYNEK